MRMACHRDMVLSACFTRPETPTPTFVSAGILCRGGRIDGDVDLAAADIVAVALLRGRDPGIDAAIRTGRVLGKHVIVVTGDRNARIAGILGADRGGFLADLVAADIFQPAGTSESTLSM